MEWTRGVTDGHSPKQQGSLNHSCKILIRMICLAALASGMMRSEGILTISERTAIANLVWTSVSNSSDFVGRPGQTLDQRATRLVDLGESTVDKLGIKGRKALQWATAEAICAYVVKNVRFHVYADLQGEDRWRANAPSNLVAQSSMRAQCSGFAMLGRDLANATTARTGLKGSYIWGWTRVPGLQPKAFELGNHGWTLFIFEDGEMSPGDTTMIARAIEATADPNNLAKRPFAFFCLPKTQLEIGYFKATRWGFSPPGFANTYNIDFSKTKRTDGQDPTQKLTWFDWDATNLDYWLKQQRVLESRFRWSFSPGT